MNREDAEEYTQAVAQVHAGGWRLVLWAQQQGVPKALGLSTRDWVRDRLGGYVTLSIPERRQALKQPELKELSSRKAAEILGEDQMTIVRDRKVLAEENSSGHSSDSEENSSLVFQDELSNHMERFSGLTGEVEWYTPSEYLNAAVEVMGAIELDPASSDLAQKHVQAERYFTIKEDGLKQRWFGHVFLNPPYKMPVVRDFVEKMVSSSEAGDIAEGILLVSNATDTEWFHRAARACSAICFTRGRISFLKAKDGHIEKKEAPTNGQAFFYFGPNPDRFSEVFSQYGLIFGPSIRQLYEVRC